MAVTYTTAQPVLVELRGKPSQDFLNVWRGVPGKERRGRLIIVVWKHDLWQGTIPSTSPLSFAPSGLSGLRLGASPLPVSQFQRELLEEAAFQQLSFTGEVRVVLQCRPEPRILLPHLHPLLTSFHTPLLWRSSRQNKCQNVLSPFPASCTQKSLPARIPRTF